MRDETKLHLGKRLRFYWQVIPYHLLDSHKNKCILCTHTGFHKFWREASIDSTVDDFLQHKVNQTSTKDSERVIKQTETNDSIL